LDLNTLVTGRHYYSLSGNWEPSQVPGTVMLRPVMRGEGSTTSSDEGSLLNDLFMIYPQSVTRTGYPACFGTGTADFVIDVISLSGAWVMSLARTDHPDFSSLPSGTYLIIIKTPEGKPLSLIRFIKIN